MVKSRKKKIKMHRVIIVLAILVILILGIYKALAAIVEKTISLFSNKDTIATSTNIEKEDYSYLTLSAVRRFNDAFSSNCRWP